MNNKISIAVLGCSVGIALFLSSQGNKFNKISEKLDKIISNQETIWLKTNELKIDSLQLEIMDFGAELDSMKLKYDENWVFTN